MFINSLLDLIPYSIKIPFHLIVDYWHSLSDEELKKLKSIKKNKRFIIMGVPEHGNMGDQAIVYAEEAFIKKYFDCDVIEISKNSYRGNKRKIKKYINKEDVIIITGGGSIGSLWKNEHNHIVNIIKSFSENQMIIFPQTIFFKECEEREIDKFKKILMKHKNLIMCLREMNSYNFAINRKLLPENKLLLVPDIVLFLNFTNNLGRKYNQKSCLVIERNDKEKTAEIEKIEEKLECTYKVNKSDTVIRHLRVTKENREKELLKLIELISNSGFVVTDRLHGMIMSIISGTPCIALDNSSKKVSGVYEFIKDISTVKLIKDKNEISEINFKKMIEEPRVYNNTNIIKYYDNLAQAIMNGMLNKN